MTVYPQRVTVYPQGVTVYLVVRAVVCEANGARTDRGLGVEDTGCEALALFTKPGRTIQKTSPTPPAVRAWRHNRKPRLQVVAVVVR